MAGHPLWPPSGLPFNLSGMPQPTPDQLSDWGKLQKGQPLGKTVVVANVSTEDSPTNLPAPMSILQIQGKDEDALNLSLVLAPPKIMPIDAQQGAGNWQALSGFKSIQELEIGDLNPSWPEVSAIIEWGIGGINQKAIVDFRNGATVNLAASYVRVWGQLEDQGPYQAPDMVAFQLGANVSAGFARGTGACRTMGGTVLANQATATYAIPAFARRVRLFGSAGGIPPTMTSLWIRFLTAQLGNNAGDVLFTANTQNPIDIPSMGMYFQVIDQTGVNSEWTAVFELSI